MIDITKDNGFDSIKKSIDRYRVGDLIIDAKDFEAGIYRDYLNFREKIKDRLNLKIIIE